MRIPLESAFPINFLKPAMKSTSSHQAFFTLLPAKNTFFYEEDLQTIKKINSKLTVIGKMSCIRDRFFSLKNLRSLWQHFSETRTLLMPVKNSAHKIACLINFIEVQSRCLLQMPSTLLDSGDMPSTEIDLAMNELSHCLAAIRDDIVLLASPDMRKFIAGDAWSGIQQYRNRCRHIELLCQFIKALIDSRLADVDFIPKGINSAEEIRVNFSNASSLIEEFYHDIHSPRQTDSTSLLSWLADSIVNFSGLSHDDTHSREYKTVIDAVDVHLQRNVRAVGARFNLAKIAKKLADEDMGLTPENKLRYLKQKQRCFSNVGMWQAPLINMHTLRATLELMHACVGKIKLVNENDAADLQHICHLNLELISNNYAIVETATTVFLGHTTPIDRIRAGLSESTISNEEAIGHFVELGNRCEASAKRYDAFVNMLNDFDFIDDEVKTAFANTAAELRRMRLTIISELERRGYVAPELPTLKIPQTKKNQQRLLRKKTSTPIPANTPKNATSKKINDSQQSTAVMTTSVPTDQSNKLDDAGDDILIPEYFGIHFKSVNKENKLQQLDKEAATLELKLALEKKRVAGMLKDPDAWRTQTMEQIIATVEEQNNALDLHGLYTDFTISRLNSLAKFELQDEETSRIQQKIQLLKEEHMRLVVDVSNQQFPNPRAIRNMVKVGQIAEWKMTKEGLQYADPKTEETNLFDVIQVSRKEGNSDVAWFEAHAHYTVHDERKNYIKNAIHLKHISQATKGSQHEMQTGENIKRWKLSQQDFRELFIR